MADLDDYLARWQQAGVIDEEAAERIRRFEAQAEAKARPERPGIVEALLYVGLAVIGVGAFVLVALVWEDLAAWARIAVTAAPGVFALALGELLRSAGEPGLRRGGSLAWVLGAGLLTGCAGVIAYEAGWDDPNGAIAAAAFAVALTFALWMVLPWHPQLAALGAALLFLSIAIGVRAAHDGPAVAAGVLAGLAALWIAAAETGWLKPRVTARPLGGFALAAGAYLVGVDPALPLVFDSLTLLAGVALIGLSIYRGSFVYMVFGVGVLFVGFVTFTMQRVPDPVVGALVLMLAGLVLVVVVVALARWRPWAVRR